MHPLKPLKHRVNVYYIKRQLDKYCALNLEFMNMLQNFEFPVRSLTNNFCTCHFNYEFAKITQNNGHYAVQGHSKSPIFVPIDSPYATSY